MQAPLFAQAADKNAALTPLAERMRPRSLAEVVGQEKLLGDKGFLSAAVRAKKLPSLILWGPPGTGKTTIARVLGREIGAYVETLSAVTAGVKELRAALEAAEQRRALEQKATLLFVDEIHRFNKGQQDALLHHVERGAVILVGATTENPSFEVNGALLSRCRVVVLEALSDEALLTLLERAAHDKERGLGWAHETTDAEREAMTAIIGVAQGDARRALAILDIAASLGEPVTKDLITKAAQHNAIRYDHSGDQHYQVASALIKSLRGSDPDAALYYVARMLEGGEDPVFIARRLVIFASEDIGNADPNALAVAINASASVQLIGMPEAKHPLAQATTYLAVAPKSNRSMLGLNAAIAAVQAHGPLPVPAHLVNATTGLMKKLGMGKGYAYPHDEADGIGKQTYLPDALIGSSFYEPSEHGIEKRMQDRLALIRRAREGE